MSSPDASQHSADPLTAEQILAMDAYLERTVVQPDEHFARIRQAADEADMPAIEVSSAQGKLLHLLARISGARRVLEVGTLAGFSTLWLARGVGEQGTVTTCEFEPRHAEVARRNLDAAGVGDRVEILLGPAEDSLTSLRQQQVEPFDLIFLDADKASMDRYLELSLELSRPGTVIVGDNVVRGGSVLTDQDDPDSAGIRRFLSALGEDPRTEATAIQTVGAKPWDGFSLAVVNQVPGR